MGFSEVKRMELTEAGLLKDYDKHIDLWRAMALEADRAMRVYLPSPLPDDVVEFLYPALKVSDKFREYLSRTSVRADKWYRTFADYILYKEWNHVLAARKPAGGATA